MGAEITSQRPRCARELPDLLQSNVSLYEKEFDFPDYDLIGQRILDCHWIIQMIPASQDVLFVILWSEALVLLAEHLLKEAYVGPHEDLDEIRCIEVMIEFLDVILVASRLHFGDDEAFVLFDGLLDQVAK